MQKSECGMNSHALILLYYKLMLTIHFGDTNAMSLYLYPFLKNI